MINYGYSVRLGDRLRTGLWYTLRDRFSYQAYRDLRTNLRDLGLNNEIEDIIGGIVE